MKELEKYKDEQDKLEKYKYKQGKKKRKKRIVCDDKSNNNNKKCIENHKDVLILNSKRTRKELKETSKSYSPPKRTKNELLMKLNEGWIKENEEEGCIEEDEQKEGWIALEKEKEIKKRPKQQQPKPIPDGMLFKKIKYVKKYILYI